MAKKAVMFAPNQKLRITVQDGLEQRGAATPTTQDHDGTVRFVAWDSFIDDIASELDWVFRQQILQSIS